MNTDTLGYRIRKARKAAGYNQTALGDILGAKQTTVSGWETDTAEPGAYDIANLCAVLDVSADWLLGTGKEAEAVAQLQEVYSKLADLTEGSLTVRHLFPAEPAAPLEAAAA